MLDRVPFDASGCPEGSFEVVPLGGDFVSQPGFNAYGIAATPDGSTLFVVHSALGTIYAVDPVSGVADEIDLGGDAVPSGDGLLLDGPILHVVQNAVNARFGTPPTASTSYDVVRVDKVSVAR